MSTGDLGDIVETESPPKSPLGSHKATSTTDTVTFNLSSTTTSAIYRKTDSTRTEETDIESLSPTSKVTSPLSKGSPPRPSSPTAVEHVGTDPMSPCDFGGIRGGRSGLASAAAANTEMLTLMGNREQPKRLAEYNRNSWAELEESGDVKVSLGPSNKDLMSPTIPTSMGSKVQESRGLATKASHKQVKYQSLACWLVYAYYIIYFIHKCPSCIFGIYI